MLTLSPPVSDAALISAAREISARILAGTVTPREGAERVWDLTGGADPNPELHTFVYAAEEWRTHPQDGERFTRGIMAAARELAAAA
jgi:hypothetical protein